MVRIGTSLTVRPGPGPGPLRPVSHRRPHLVTGRPINYMSRRETMRVTGPNRAASQWPSILPVQIRRMLEGRSLPTIRHPRGPGQPVVAATVPFDTNWMAKREPGLRRQMPPLHRRWHLVTVKPISCMSRREMTPVIGLHPEVLPVPSIPVHRMRRL